jgi:hypothetical protein
MIVSQSESIPSPQRPTPVSRPNALRYFFAFFGLVALSTSTGSPWALAQTPPSCSTPTALAATSPLRELLSEFTDEEMAHQGTLPLVRRVQLDHQLEQYTESLYPSLSRSPGRQTPPQLSLPSPSQIVQELETLECLHRTRPQTVQHIAARLQTRWDSLYGGLLHQQLRERQERDSTNIGMGIGVLTFLAVLPRRPDLLPRYFALLRGFLPLVGAAGGHWIASQNLSPPGSTAGSRQTPPMPAQILHLGVPRSQAPSRFEELAPMLASIGSGIFAERALGLAIQTVRGLQGVSAPARFNPWVLIASLAVGILVEDSLEDALLERRRTQAFAAFQADRLAVLRHRCSLNEGDLMEAIDRLAVSTDALYQLLDANLLSLWRELYQESLRSGNSIEHLLETGGYRHRFARLLSAADQQPDPNIEAFSALAALDSAPEVIDENGFEETLTPQTQIRTRYLQAQYERLHEAEQDRQQRSLDLFPEFLRSLHAARTQRLSTRFERNPTPSNPENLLIETVAYLSQIHGAGAPAVAESLSTKLRWRDKIVRTVFSPQRILYEF